jgi:HlyD family secretion protein
MPRGTSPRGQGAGKNGGKDGLREIWILKDGNAQAMKVKTGVSDGRHTEVLAGELREGMQVITDSESPAK